MQELKVAPSPKHARRFVRILGLGPGLLGVLFLVLLLIMGLQIAKYIAKPRVSLVYENSSTKVAARSESSSKQDILLPTPPFTTVELFVDQTSLKFYNDVRKLRKGDYISIHNIDTKEHTFSFGGTDITIQPSTTYDYITNVTGILILKDLSFSESDALEFSVE